ncbi:MAG TPA: SDR family oxidoreductase [Terriglobales bacterium]|nr:SDR family oxidoreductase [Terriglobales bacterium]
MVEVDFRDQVVLITGASRGIGRALAIDLARRGATVIGCARSQQDLEETLAEMRRLSPRSTVRVCDVSKRQEVDRMMKEVLAEFGRIDILVNNAGIGMRKPFVETSLDTIEDILRTNYLGAVYCTHTLLPSMIARRSGHIVNLSSGAGIIGTLNMAGYSASKFAMNGLSESLYHELKPLGIHLSVICPGPVRTDFNRPFAHTEPESPPALVISAEAVSKSVIRAIEKKRFEVILPRWLALACRFKRTAPGLFLALVHRRFRAYVRKSGES